MIVLDTDHVSLLQHTDSAEGQAIVERLAASADRDIATTVITVEEQMRAWLAVIARNRELDQQAACYDRLIAFLRFFGNWKILPFDENAVNVFRNLHRAHLRLGTTDLKIAAIAIANRATLLSRNLQDFLRVPGLRVEDWTSR